MKDNRDNGNGFTKEHTLILKGILILMLLFHHLFYPDELQEYSVNTFIEDPILLLSLVTWFKICVAGFCFITAYGITKKFMSIQELKFNDYAQVTASRLIKLEMTIFPVYIIALLYKTLVMHMSMDYGYNIVQNVIYGLFDMLGLANYAGTPTINVTWWYLSLAILLIVSMPLIYYLYSKGRYLLIAPACLLPAVLFINTDVLYTELLPVAFLGTAFAYENWFEKIKKWNTSWRKPLLFAAMLLCGWFSFELNRYVNYALAWLLIFFLPILVQEYISYVPILSHVLKFIGIHATNIFIIHTFIYRYFYAGVIYGLSDSWKIYMAVLAFSLLVSAIIESAKALLGYNNLINLLCDKVKKKL
ncbi:MAG: acyltransferase family protein [Clostridiales bacterium]|nr:acyltransferase family protein [Clostridiales bacterium]